MSLTASRVRLAARTAGACLLLCGSASAADSYAVVVNNANPATSLDRRVIAALFMRRVAEWPGGVPVLPVDGPTTPDSSDRVVDRDELERAFARLPVEQRAVFVLHHYLGLPLVEIAEMLEIPAGTARSRLHYATRGLRDALTADVDHTIPGGRLA